MSYQHITKEQLENEYVFKLIKKVLKREYKWVIDVIIPPNEEINKYSLIFFDIEIDPKEFQNQTGALMYWWVKSSAERAERTNAPYQFSAPFLGSIFEMHKSATELITEMEETMKAVAKSPAIPEELRFKPNRNFSVSLFIIPNGVDLNDVQITEYKPTK